MEGTRDLNVHIEHTTRLCLTSLLILLYQTAQPSHSAAVPAIAASLTCHPRDRDPCANFPDLCSAGNGLCVVKKPCEYECVCPPDGHVGRDCSTSNSAGGTRQAERNVQDSETVGTDPSQAEGQVGGLVDSLLVFPPDLFWDLNHIDKHDDFMQTIASSRPDMVTMTTAPSTMPRLMATTESLTRTGTHQAAYSPTLATAETVPIRRNLPTRYSSSPLVTKSGIDPLEDLVPNTPMTLGSTTTVSITTATSPTNLVHDSVTISNVLTNQLVTHTTSPTPSQAEDDSIAQETNNRAEDDAMNTSLKSTPPTTNSAPYASTAPTDSTTYHLHSKRDNATLPPPHPNNGPPQHGLEPTTPATPSSSLPSLFSSSSSLSSSPSSSTITTATTTTTTTSSSSYPPTSTSQQRPDMLPGNTGVDQFTGSLKPSQASNTTHEDTIAPRASNPFTEDRTVTQTSNSESDDINATRVSNPNREGITVTQASNPNREDFTSPGVLEPFPEHRTATRVLNSNREDITTNSQTPRTNPTHDKHVTTAPSKVFNPQHPQLSAVSDGQTLTTASSGQPSDLTVTSTHGRVSTSGQGRVHETFPIFFSDDVLNPTQGDHAALTRPALRVFHPMDAFQMEGKP